MGKNWKRRLSWTLCVVFVLGSVMGCSSGKKTESTQPEAAEAETSAGEEQITLTYLETQPTETKTALMKEMIDGFMKENPNIKVEIISTPNDQAAEKLFNLAAANQLPDVIEMNDSWLAPLTSSGNIEDLTPYVENWDEKDNVVDAAYKLGRVIDDKLYYIPYGLWGTATYYNVEMLEQTGLEPPVTTDDFYEVAMAMTDAANGKYGYALRGGSYGMTHAIMWMLGEVGSPNVIDPETGKCVFDSEKAIEGLRKYAALYQDGAASPDTLNWAFRECVEGFTTGASGLLIQSNEVVEICNEKMGEGTFGTTMLPVGSSGKTFDTSGQTGYAMSAKSEHKEEAWMLLSYLLDPEVCLDYTVSMGFTPINTKMADNPAFSEGPVKVYMEQVMSENIEFANNPSYLNEWGDFVTTFGTEQLQKMFLGEQSVEDTAKNLADFLNEAEASYRAGK